MISSRHARIFPLKVSRDKTMSDRESQPGVDFVEESLPGTLIPCATFEYDIDISRKALYEAHGRLAERGNSST